MNKRIAYSDGPIGDVKVVRDFLPAPADMVVMEDQVKVTIGLSKAGVDFFRDAARQPHA